MIENEFLKALNNIHNSYMNALTAKYPNPKKIKIGRSTSQSSNWEHEIANALERSAISNKKNYHYWVDFPITVKSNSTGKTETYYPDILVTEGLDLSHFDKQNIIDPIFNQNKTQIEKQLGKANPRHKTGKIVAVIDIKTDIGYVKMKDFNGPDGTRYKSEDFLTSSLASWSWNYFPGAYLPHMKNFNKWVGQFEFKNVDFKQIQKFAIISTESNSHKVSGVTKVEPYTNALKTPPFNYEVLFLLGDDYHPNKQIPSPNSAIIPHFIDTKRKGNSPNTPNENAQCLQSLNSVF